MYLLQNCGNYDVVTITLKYIIDTKYESILRKFTHIYSVLVSHGYVFSKFFYNFYVV